ncbi:MAG: hypothetical protein WAS54_09385 [Scrofimicrobium sp.]
MAENAIDRGISWVTDELPSVVANWLTGKLPKPVIEWVAKYQRLLFWGSWIVVAAVLYKAMVIGYYSYELWWMALACLVSVAMWTASEVGKQHNAVVAKERDGSTIDKEDASK